MAVVLKNVCDSAVSISGDVLNIRRLHVLDVPVVWPDDVDAVGVERCPHPVADRHEDGLQVDVVAEDEPQAKHHLEEDDDPHHGHPGEHQAPDVGADCKPQHGRQQGKQHEVANDEPTGAL